MAENNQSRNQLGRVLSDSIQGGYFSIIATLVLLIVLIFLIYPAVQHITKLNKELADAKVVKTNLENKLTNIQQAKLNLDQIREGLPTLELALPLGSDVTPYLRKIESFARKYKLSITAVQFSTVPLSKPEIGDDLRTKDLSYNLTLEGNFTNFRKFLKDLESFIRTSDVTTANLARDNGGVVKQALQITTYYLGEDSNAAGSVSSQSTSGGVNE